MNVMNVPYTVLRSTIPSDIEDINGNTKIIHWKELHKVVRLYIQIQNYQTNVKVG